MKYNIVITILICIICYPNNIVLSNSHHKRKELNTSKALQYKGYYKVGTPYKIKGRIYHPRHPIRNKKEIGYASWYKANNSTTANGDTYLGHRLTAAHKTLPMPCIIKVTNLENQRQLILLVNDRGPFIRKRILDVSEYAAELLGFKRQGVVKVKVEFLLAETKKFTNLIFKNNKKTPTIGYKIHDVDYYIELLNKLHRTSYKRFTKHKKNKIK